MKKLLLLAFLVLGLTSTAEVYPGSADRAITVGQAYPESGDRVVIGDMTYVLVRAGDWFAVTSSVARVEAMYNQMHATESGRTMLHGKRGHTTITNGTITVEYADGWKAVEAVKANARPKTNAVRRVSSLTGRGTTPSRPDRLEALLKQRDAILKSKPREVTVEVTGGAK